MGLDVVHEAAVTLALEATGSVETRAVVAHCRHERALVYLDAGVGHRVHDLARLSAAQQQVLL